MSEGRACDQCNEKKWYTKLRSGLGNSTDCNLVPAQSSECWRCPASKAKLVECTCGNDWSAGVGSDPDANVVTVVPPQHQQPDEEEELSEEEVRRYIAANPEIWEEAIAKAEREIPLEEKEKGKEGETTARGQSSECWACPGSKAKLAGCICGNDWSAGSAAAASAAGGVGADEHLVRSDGTVVLLEEDASITDLAAAAAGCLPGCINPLKGLHHRRCPNFLRDAALLGFVRMLLFF